MIYLEPLYFLFLASKISLSSIYRAHWLQCLLGMFWYTFPAVAVKPLRIFYFALFAMSDTWDAILKGLIWVTFYPPPKKIQKFIPCFRSKTTVLQTVTCSEGINLGHLRRENVILSRKRKSHECRGSLLAQGTLFELDLS